MALLLLKSVFFPRSKEKAYTLLPSFGQGSRDSSIDENGVRGHESEKDVGEKKKRALSVDPRLIADATIGLSDGLTVPFALTAGLSALGDTNVVIYGGLAELIAGGISMGLGGYLGARGEAQAYQTTLASTRQLIATSPSSAAALAASAFDSYTTISPFLLSSLTSQLSASPSELEDFLMRFHHQLPETAGTASRAYVSAVTIAAGYFFGGLVPLMPYFLAATNQIAFAWSVAVMAVALFTFGYAKTLLLGEGKKRQCLWAGAQMVVLGGVAAAAAMGCVRAVGS